MPEEQVPNLQTPLGREAFISYASHDKGVADAVCKALESAGLVCWIAPRNVIPGESFAGAIVHAIDSTKVIVLVLSEHAATSQHVLREVERASSKRHPVIAFRIDLAPMPADLEYFLNTSQWLDASAAGVKHALPKLVDAVKVALTQTSAAARANPHPSSAAKTRRHSGAKIVALSLIAAVALSYFAVNKFWLSKHSALTTSLRTAEIKETSTTQTVPDKSIAVLPFVDMSEKHDQEYLSDGLSEELIDMLAKVPDLRVPARTSSFYFKGKPDDISAIASRLRVAHILEGSVRKAGDHVRITVQLVRADNGYHLWSQTYDRELHDIFKVQDEIAGAVVRALKVSLLGAEPPRSIPNGNGEAYTLYLQARTIYRNASTHADDERAVAYLRKALALDPAFAPAWASLADYRCDDATYYEISLDAQARKEVHDAAARAVELNPDLSDAHYAMGKCLALIDWNWKEGEAELRKALELDPLNSDALVILSYVIYGLDAHSPEAVQLAKRAVDRDPLYAFNFNNLAVAYFMDGKYAEAEQALRQALDLNSTADGISANLAGVLLYRGDAAMALKALEREPDEPIRENLRPAILDALGRGGDANRVLAACETKYGNVDPVGIAAVYARRKDLDRAFYWLDRAYRQHNFQLPILHSHPDFTSLRSDPRYKALLNKMNMPE